MLSLNVWHYLEQKKHVCARMYVSEMHMYSALLWINIQISGTCRYQQCCVMAHDMRLTQ